MTLNELGFKLIASLTNLNLTISTCESFTGGSLGNILTNVPGASKVYKGGYIAYSQEMKELLGIPKELIEKYGLVSEQVARSMAKQTQQLLKTNFAVALTGNAGPTVQSGVGVGVAFVAIIFNDEQLILKLESENLLREDFKNFAIEQVLTTIYKIIQ